MPDATSDAISEALSFTCSFICPPASAARCEASETALLASAPAVENLDSERPVIVPALSRMLRPIISQATPAPIKSTGNGLSAACRPRLRTNCPARPSRAKSKVSSTRRPGLMRERSSLSESTISPRALSASRSSCALVVMVGPHLTLRGRGVFLQLVDRSVRNELFRFQAAGADRQKNQSNDEHGAADGDRRPVRRESGRLQSGYRGLQQYDQGRHQQYGADHDQRQAGAEAAELFGYFGARELAFLAQQHRELHQQIGQDVGNRPFGMDRHDILPLF